MCINATTNSPGPAGPGFETGRAAGWRGQFVLPTGFLGEVAGRLMAWKNAAMCRQACDWLDVQPDDRVLEIGFGPGTLIRMLAGRATRGFVAGVDPSVVRVQQAERRSRELLQTGRVELRQGTAARLPYELGRFTKVVAVNSVPFWSSPDEDLQELRRVMRHGGLLLLGLRLAPPPGRFALAPGFTADEVDAIQERLRRASFLDVRTEVPQLGGEMLGVLANR